MALSLETLAADRAPGKAVRLVFFDVDGTLLDRQGRLSPETVNAIERLHQRDILTAFATGRPDFAVVGLQSQLKLTGPSVYYTGGLCYWQGQAIAEHRLEVSQWQPLARRAQAQSFYLEGYYPDAYLICCDNDISREHARHLGVKPRVKALQHWPALGLRKLLLGADLRVQPQGLAPLEAAFPHLQFAYAQLPSRPHWQFASVVDRTVDKTALFHRLLAILNLEPEQVAAFGDGGSDKEFLAAAGHGVAMGNAGPEVVACARWLTRPSWSNGVAYGLAKLLGER